MSTLVLLIMTPDNIFIADLEGSVSRPDISPGHRHECDQRRQADQAEHDAAVQLARSGESLH